MPRRGLLLLLLASAPAYAQDGPDVAPPAPALPPAPLADRFVWERRAAFAARVAGVAVQPIPAGAWLAVDERGGVWLSEDEGGRWENVVRPIGGFAEPEELPDDEALLLEAEARRDEALDRDAPEATTPGRGAEEVEEIELPEAPDENAREEARELATSLVEAAKSESAALPVVWVDPTMPETAFLARPDGLWRSSSGGRTWEHVREAEEGDPAVTSFHRMPDGSLVLGTTDGVRFSTDDGVSWIDVQDATDGARVAAVIAEDGALWAATDRGLFESTNGLAWERVTLPASDAVRAVVPDPAWDQGFWVATQSTLLRTDDGGATFYVAGRQPLRGLRGLVHLDDPGHLLAWSDDGVWESMDGGVAWNVADRRLGEPDVRALVVAETGPVIATPGGIWRMVTPREVTAATRRAPGLSLAESIGRSTHRDGLDIDLLALARVGVLTNLAPALELRFDWGNAAGRKSTWPSTTKDDFGNDWAAYAKLCWGSCSTTAVTFDAASEYAAYEAIDSGELYVVDGEVYQEGEPVAAAANVAQDIRSYRRYLAEHVADAWLARSRLVAETTAVRELPLRDQVLHAVQIQELDARLDALTDGAFTRTSRATPPPEESP